VTSRPSERFPDDAFLAQLGEDAVFLRMVRAELIGLADGSRREEVQDDFPLWQADGNCLSVCGPRRISSDTSDWTPQIGLYQSDPLS
jgi:hypothetical protein